MLLSQNMCNNLSLLNFLMINVFLLKAILSFLVLDLTRAVLL